MAQKRSGGKDDVRRHRLPPTVERSSPEAYLGFFLASFCLFCFWVFFGDLSPIEVLLSQAIPRSPAAYFYQHKDYSTKRQVPAYQGSHCTGVLSRI